MKLAVFFPGIGYHCDKPLLYYARKIVEKLGYDEIISLSYSYNGNNIRGNEEKMKEAVTVLYTQAKESLKEIPFQSYDEILFVSKSVGTIIAFAYANEFHISCKQVLYTPLTYTFDYFIKTMVEHLYLLLAERMVPHLYLLQEKSVEVILKMKKKQRRLV